MKSIILLVLIVIIASLGSALFHLVRKRDSGEHMVRALTVRITLSMALIVLLILAAALGWITPHGLLPVPVGVPAGAPAGG